MGYLHIDNLYKNQTILLFRRCYALEKVHGTSAHISWKKNTVSYFSGGSSRELFVALFDTEKLAAEFVALGHEEVVINGEAYGGKCQGMRDTYGADLRFIVFDVRVGRSWLSVPEMARVAGAFELEVVPWEECSTDLETLDAMRDKPSVVAVWRDCGIDKPKEGIVLRPLVEMITNDGERVIAKHKSESYRERATQPKVGPDRLAILTDARAVAEEWVTEMRLAHVLDRFPVVGMERTREVIAAMIEDIYREAAGEVVESREASREIGRRTAKLLKTRFLAQLRPETGS